MPLRSIAVAMIIIAACLIALGFGVDFLVDWLWFSAVGYPAFFWTILGTKVALFLAAFAASAILLWLNGSLAYRLAGRRGRPPPAVSPWGSATQHLPWRSLIAGGALVLAGPIAR